jgi:hypothetical protein
MDEQRREADAHEDIDGPVAREGQRHELALVAELGDEDDREAEQERRVEATRAQAMPVVVPRAKSGVFGDAACATWREHDADYHRGDETRAVGSGLLVAAAWWPASRCFLAPYQPAPLPAGAVPLTLRTQPWRLLPSFAAPWRF